MGGVGCRPWFVRRLPCRVEVERGHVITMDCTVGNVTTTDDDEPSRDPGGHLNTSSLLRHTANAPPRRTGISSFIILCREGWRRGSSQIVSRVAVQSTERERVLVQTGRQSLLFVCRSGERTVAKRLIGSGCRL